MDWPDHSPDSVLEVGGAADRSSPYPFEFDARSDFTCRVVQSNGATVCSIPLDSPQSWKRWIESPRFQNLRTIPKENVIDPEGGYEILLSARPVPLAAGRPGRERLFEDSLRSLPFAEEYWREVTQSLFVHKSVTMAMKESLALSFSTLFPTEMGGADVEVYLASNSGGFPGRIAISSTHFIDSGFTTAVIYGCNSDQMDLVTDLLTRSPDVRGHHLLSIGLFSELQRSRLEHGVADFRAASTGMIIEFGVFNNPTQRSISEDDHWGLNVKLRKHRQVAIKLAEESRAAKAHLDTIMETLNEMDPRKEPRANTSTSYSDNQSPRSPDRARTKRFKRRFRDICLQYENLAAICQTQLDNMTFLRDFSMADYSAREAKASKALGLTAMIYLPITSLATIFAMPIFDWKARWLDFYMTVVPSSSTKDGTAALDTTDPGATAVLSGYFWIYLAISLITTMLTVAGYMLYAWNWRIPFVMRWVYALMEFWRRIHLHLRRTVQLLSTTAGKYRPGRSRQPDNGILGRHAGVVDGAEGIERVEDKDVMKATHQIQLASENRGPLGEAMV